MNNTYSNLSFKISNSTVLDYVASDINKLSMRGKAEQKPAYFDDYGTEVSKIDYYADAIIGDGLEYYESAQDVINYAAVACSDFSVTLDEAAEILRTALTA